MTTANLTKVIVPCRLSYAHLWEPDSINGSEPKYSVSCIIDKNDKETIAKIKKAIEVAKDESMLHGNTPHRDGKTPAVPPCLSSSENHLNSCDDNGITVPY